ncbi:uncharacterized protein J3R85_013184 [Psidium guajava]|nr:uncharacterized protein J3R85_013184 [Psidium guajava]
MPEENQTQLRSTIDPPKLLASNLRISTITAILTRECMSNTRVGPWPQAEGKTEHMSHGKREFLRSQGGKSWK